MKGERKMKEIVKKNMANILGIIIGLIYLILALRNYLVKGGSFLFYLGFGLLMFGLFSLLLYRSLKKE